MTLQDLQAAPKAHSTIHEFFPGNTFLNFECLRILSTAPYGGCDPAEFLTAIAAIKPGDPKSWGEAWEHAASQAEAIGDAAVTRGDVVAARAAFLRASSYTRASGYMYINGPTLDSHDHRALPKARRTQSLFRRALSLLDCDAHVVEIPYQSSRDEQGETHMLPGYLYIPSAQHRLPDGTIPVLINTGGADSVQEELYYIHPQAGHQRGYAVLTFEGPGQGIVLREKGLHMRPDWETVVSQVLDWLEKYAISLKQEQGIQLDLKRTAVAGASMGGYFALRVAVDSRIKACVAIDPFYDMWTFGTRHISSLFMSASAFWGIRSPARILNEMKRYTLRDGFLTGVQCPVFITGAENSLYFDTEDHTMRIFEDLGHLGSENRRLWMPGKPEDGGLQAKIGAFDLANMQVYGFLDDVFGIQRVMEVS